MTDRFSKLFHFVRKSLKPIRHASLRHRQLSEIFKSGRGGAQKRDCLDGKLNYLMDRSYNIHQMVTKRQSLANKPVEISGPHPSLRNFNKAYRQFKQKVGKASTQKEKIDKMKSEWTQNSQGLYRALDTKDKYGKQWAGDYSESLKQFNTGAGDILVELGKQQQILKDARDIRIERAYTAATVAHGPIQSNFTDQVMRFHDIDRHETVTRRAIQRERDLTFLQALYIE